ncbi:MAG: molybdenum cofactor guanylyltransferase [Lachnospiraceae bacterium]|nr:molybdenum cofactor guanylyltransferase [Lachnospiraceae bacterium]
MKYESLKAENISAAILVGRSRRMGCDKALLVLNDQTFIGHLAQECSVCREVFVSAAEAKDYSEYGLKVIVDENKDIGPIEGIRRSLSHSVSDNVFICAYDMPFFCSDMIRYLSGLFTDDADICVFRDEERIHPLCGIYSRTVLPFAEEMIAKGSYRMTDLLSQVRTKYADIKDSPFNKETLSNINTPEEYHAVRERNSNP